MPGKISGLTNSQPASPATSAAGQRTAAAASPSTGNTAAAGSPTDSVQITDTASYLVTAEQTLSDVPVINTGRVAEVSDALANGTYKISSEKIANQLLSFERLLPDEETVA